MGESLKWALEIAEEGMTTVFLAANGGVERYTPIDTKSGIVKTDAPFRFRMIELVALILEDSSGRQHGKPMGKSFGNEQLSMIVCREFDDYVLTIGGRITP